MSIATEITRLQQAKADLKTAINAKGRAITDEPLDEYAAEVDAIVVGGGTPAVTYEVRYIDYDGTILSTQQIESGENATPPVNPDRTSEGLTFVEWNLASTNITHDLDVGATYETTDGKTHAFVTVTAVSGLTITVYFAKNDTSTLKISWGDGSADTEVALSGNRNSTHSYMSYGDYVIKIWISSGAGTWTLGNGTTSTTFIGGSTQVARDSLTKVFLGGALAAVLTDYSFNYCYGLRYVVIKKGITNLGVYCFYYCDSLYALIFPNSTIVIPSNLCAHQFRSALKYVSISGPITAYSSSAFSYCTSLQNIILPPSAATAIGDSFLSYCYSLEYAWIPDNIVTFGASVFYVCSALSKVRLSNALQIINANEFSQCQALTEIVIPASVVSIQSGAFSYCYSLRDVTILNTTSLVFGSSVFSNCYSLKEISLPPGNTSTFDGMFSNCSALESATLPTSLTSISSVFMNCVAIKHIVISALITSIGSNAFFGTKSADYVFLRTTPPTIASDTFYGIPSSKKIYVPDDSVATYKAATNWTVWANYIHPISSM